MAQTSVEWLIEELKKVHHPTEAMIMYAKKLEKQQIINSRENGISEGYRRTNNFYYDKMVDSDTYFSKTYGSKGSDEEKTKNNNMKTGTSRLMDSHLVDFTNPNANNIKSGSTTSSQTEISDEEIYKVSFKKESIDWHDGFIEGAKWYREQLKFK